MSIELTVGRYYYNRNNDVVAIMCSKDTGDDFWFEDRDGRKYKHSGKIDDSSESQFDIVLEGAFIPSEELRKYHLSTT
jgi:hypothetical protein